MGAACPQYNQLYDLKLQSPDVKKIEKENAVGIFLFLS